MVAKAVAPMGMLMDYLAAHDGVHSIQRDPEAPESAVRVPRQYLGLKAYLTAEGTQQQREAGAAKAWHDAADEWKLDWLRKEIPTDDFARFASDQAEARMYTELGVQASDVDECTRALGRAIARRPVALEAVISPHTASHRLAADQIRTLMYGNSDHTRKVLCRDNHDDIEGEADKVVLALIFSPDELSRTIGELFSAGPIPISAATQYSSDPDATIQYRDSKGAPVRLDLAALSREHPWELDDSGAPRHGSAIAPHPEAYPLIFAPTHPGLRRELESGFDTVSRLGLLPRTARGDFLKMCDVYLAPVHWAETYSSQLSVSQCDDLMQRACEGLQDALQEALRLGRPFSHAGFRVCDVAHGRVHYALQRMLDEPFAADELDRVVADRVVAELKRLRQQGGGGGRKRSRQ